METLYIIPILLFSVVVHEVMHGYIALKCGDPTAKYMGRLTLNPIPHIDLFGSILVPLFSILVAGRVFIAWAKPVPVNPLNFRNYKRDSILVSAVGPISNLFLAFCCALFVIILLNLSDFFNSFNSDLIKFAHEFLVKMFYSGIYLNIVLGVFNLIPVPPLDGSHVLASILPDRLGESYRQIGFFGIFIVIFLMRVPAFSTIFFSIVRAIATPFEFLIQVLT
ncbi:Zn-dependent protease (includes SpoIVFB) [Candidatus Thermokryptus mobilis]|uniref:Zn-dependent protease (Includes SpoIVFB) n=1 Tax=Candidatus Thermokryptus mobilis TaxID=1643428 RepID=A0A0S4NCA8_9BACT|nr:site-2 protease family protein [Candidatus Thermokryptus mobilis]CUU08988.1 Zn-dependent protease (includes SpoIVFB) [Candidatus Thermokryptus mobilis]